MVGGRDTRLLFRHIGSNTIYPTLVIASLNIGTDVLTFAALNFLGIDNGGGLCRLGQLISAGRNWMPSLTTYWWLVVWPRAALLFFVLGWNLVSDALRDVLDPRMHGRR